MVNRFKQHEIDGRALVLLTEADLKEIGLSTVGVRKRIVAEIRSFAGHEVPTDLFGSLQSLRTPEANGVHLGELFRLENGLLLKLRQSGVCRAAESII